MIGARSAGVWVVVGLFLAELVGALIFSAYVLRDALKDYRNVRKEEHPGTDALEITEMFVRTETARMVKMSSFLAVVVLSFTQPVADTIQDGWYVILTRLLFLVIGGALAYNSIKEFRTRRKLMILKEGGKA